MAASAEEPVRTPRADARRSDQRIILAAARVLAESPDAPLQRIADEAGVSRRTVHRRYANREALREAVLATAVEEAAETVEAVLAEHEDPVAALRALIVSLAVRTRRYPILLGELAAGRELESPPPRLVAVRRRVAELIDGAQRTGALRADVPGDLILRAVQGTILMASRSPLYAELDAEALGEQVAELVLGGAVPG